jgi:hypothetical protein
MENMKRKEYYRCLNTGVVFRKSDFKTNPKKGGYCFSHHKSNNIVAVDAQLNNFFERNLVERKLIGSCRRPYTKIEWLFKGAA